VDYCALEKVSTYSEHALTLHYITDSLPAVFWDSQNYFENGS